MPPLTKKGKPAPNADPIVWRRKTIDIVRGETPGRHPNGLTDTVDAQVLGPLAVHKALNEERGGYTVTHVACGLSIVYAIASETEAKAVALTLMEQIGDILTSCSEREELQEAILERDDVMAWILACRDSGRFEEWE